MSIFRDSSYIWINDGKTNLLRGISKYAESDGEGRDGEHEENQRAPLDPNENPPRDAVSG